MEETKEQTPIENIISQIEYNEEKPEKINEQTEIEQPESQPQNLQYEQLQEEQPQQTIEVFPEQEPKETEKEEQYPSEQQYQKEYIPQNEHETLYQEQEDKTQYDEIQEIQDTLPEELTSQTESEEEKPHKNPYKKNHHQETITSPSLESIQKTLNTHTKTFKEAISISLETTTKKLKETLHDIAYLKNKLHNHKSECNKITTCNECSLNPSCGWCPLSNKCVDGTEYGPIDESECSVYEYDKCSQESDCSRYQSCESCISDVACAWCNDDLNGLGCIDQIDDKCPLEKRFHLWDNLNNECPFKKNKFLGRDDERRFEKEFDMAPKEKEYIEEEIKRLNLFKEELMKKKESLERMKEIIDE